MRPWCVPLAAAVFLSGCGAQGSYTGELAANALTRMDALRVRTEMDFAEQAFRAGRLDRAEERAAEALAIDPEAPAPHALLARIALERGRASSAVRAAERAVGAAPRDPEARYVLGMSLEMAGDAEGALAAYAEASSLDPEDAHYVLARAEVLLTLGRGDDAERLLAGWPAHAGHPGAMQMLAHLALSRGDTSRAVDWLTSAMILAPDDPGLREDLAFALIAGDRHADALPHLERLRAEEATSERRDLLRQLAGCLSATGRLDESRRVLRELAESAGTAAERAEHWAEAGMLSVRLGDAAGLREAASRVVAEAPDSADGYVLWALWYAGAGDGERMEVSLEAGRARARDQREHDLLERVAATLRSSGAFAGVETDG